MRTIRSLALLLILAPIMAWGQSFTVTVNSSGPTAIVTTTGATSVTVSENSASPSANFIVTDNNSPSVKINVAAGGSYIFIASPGTFPAGTTVGYVQAATGSGYTFLVVQSQVPLTKNISAAKLGGGGGGSGTLTGVTTGSGTGLMGGGLSGTLNLSLINTCSATQVLAWNGSAWACAANGTGIALGTAGQMPVMNTGATAFAPVTISKDCTVSVAGAFTCLSTNGTPFAATATSATAATGLNGASIPLSKTIVGTNGAGQIVDASGATLSNNTSGTAGGLSANIAESQVTGLVSDLASKVPTSTTVNSHALSANVVISASDLTTGTLPHAQLPTLLSGDIPNNAANTTGTASNLSPGGTADSIFMGNSAGSGSPPGFVAGPGSCSSAANAVIYNNATHTWGCNTLSGSGTVNTGVAGQLGYFAGSTNVISGNFNATISGGVVTLGQANTTAGGLNIEGGTSGFLNIVAQLVAGTPVWTAGTASGTPAVTASLPLAIAAATGNIACATCATAAAALTNNAVVIGQSGQASATIPADTTATHALFATAGAPAFRALATTDLPIGIPLANVGSAGLSGTSPIGITAAGAISLKNSAAANVTSSYGTDTAFFTASGGASTNGAVITGDAIGGIQSSSTLLSALATSASPTFTGTVTMPLPTAGIVTTTSGGVLGSEAAVSNAQLANSATTVNGQTCTLGSPCTIPFQTNGAGNTSQAGINLLTSTANSVGLTVTPTNSGTNQEKFEITGGSYSGSAASAAIWTTARTLAGNSVNGSTNVPFANKFIVQGTTDAGLSGAQFLGALGTGILKNTTSTGVLSPAAAADVIGLWSGTCSGSTYLNGSGACSTPSGTGNMSTSGSPAAFQTGVWTGSTTMTGVGPGTTGQALLSGGASANPSYGALNLAGGSSIVTGALPNSNIGTLAAGSNGLGALAVAAYPGSGVPCSTGSAWCTSFTKFGTEVGVATSADPGVFVNVPMVSDGSHGMIPSASGALQTGAFAAAYVLPAATSLALGGVKPDGTSILNTAGAISVTPASVGAVPITTMTTLADLITGGSSGAPTRLAGPTSPNGIPQVLMSTPSGGVAAAEVWAIPGVPIDAQAGTSYTVPATDDVHLVTSTNSSAVGWTGFPLANNYTFAFLNLGAGTVTYTPASGSVYPGAAATTQIPQNWFGFQYTDNTNSYMPVLPTAEAFADTSAGGLAETYNATTGKFGTISVPASAPVLSVSNSDGSLFVSPTTGAVTASLNISHANSWFAAQTFQDPYFGLQGASGSGITSFHSASTGSTNFTVTVPTNTGTLAETNLAQTFSAVQTISATNGLVLSAMSGTQCLEEISGVVTATGSGCGGGGGGLSFPATVSGTTVANGVPYLSSTTNLVGGSAAFTFDGTQQVNLGGSGNKGQLDLIGTSTGGNILQSANTTGSSVTDILPAKSFTFAGLNISGGQTFTTAQTISSAGAASTPGLDITGAPYTAGSATTNQPQTYLDAGGTEPTTWSTSGTMFGENAPSAFAGKLIDLHVNGGASVFSVDSSGDTIVQNLTVNGTCTNCAPAVGSRPQQVQWGWQAGSSVGSSTVLYGPFPFAIATSIPTNDADSTGQGYFALNTAPAATWVATVYRIPAGGAVCSGTPSSIGTISVSTSNIATFSITATSFAKGDCWEFVAPSVVDTNAPIPASVGIYVLD